MNHEVSRLAEELSTAAGLKTELDMPLASLCTYRVGGNAALGVHIEDSRGLDRLLTILQGSDVATLAIGRGSNLLVSEAGFPGIAITLGKYFSEFGFEGNTLVARGAAPLPLLARASVREGLTGFGWAVGVPGSVGGAVRMNAGGHGSDMAANLVSFEIADLKTGMRETWGHLEWNPQYRASNVAAHQIVTKATISLEHAPASELEDLSEIVAWRRRNQPGGANAGSVFANPPNDSAGRLIDATGLKGSRAGSASVSEKHANFIQADTDGSSEDIVDLMIDIVQQVRSEHGVTLRPETRLIGFDKDKLSLLGVG